jgi:hypothetical protein
MVCRDQVLFADFTKKGVNGLQANFGRSDMVAAGLQSESLDVFDGFDFDFDIDRDSETRALSDGLLVIRYLFGFTGDSLIGGVFSEVSRRNTAESIVNYLSFSINELDIDGDGEAGALTDGLLLIRYQFGFSGDALISGAVSENAQRTTAEQIETYISERIPAI